MNVRSAMITIIFQQIKKSAKSVPGVSMVVLFMKRLLAVLNVKTIIIFLRTSKNV